MRMTVEPPPPPPGEGEVRLYVKNVFEVRVKSKKSVRKFKTPFRSTKRLSPFAILHKHGRKDIDVDRAITWVGGGGGGVNAPIPPRDYMWICDAFEVV